jgi:RNA polymerase sigma factor (sigma-70 family)
MTAPAAALAVASGCVVRGSEAVARRSPPSRRPVFSRMTFDASFAHRDAHSPGGFPLTRFSVVEAAGSADVSIRQRAWDALIRSYWRAVYKYIRIRWQIAEDDARDLTQAFFTSAIDAGFFQRFDPARARFRTYLRLCLHGFIANDYKAAGRKKRGGDFRIVPLDFEDAEGELRHVQVAADGDPEAFFRQESIRSLFSLAVTALRAQCADRGREVHFRLFERYDLALPEQQDRPTYQQLADEFALPVTQVTNFLAAVRRDFRRIVLEQLREISGTEAEFRAEAIELLGIDPNHVAV